MSFRLRSYFISASAALLMLCVSQVGAASFSVGPKGYGVLVSGEIKKGDVAKLALFLLDNTNTNLSTVFLNSSGGDVLEALVIGEMMRENFSATVVPESAMCFSACTILWAAGVDRYLGGRNSKLGFHRLSFKRREIDVRKSQAVTSSVSQLVADFFRKVALPPLLIEKMDQTPPTDIYVVDARWLVEHDLDRAISYQPAFLDVVEKECGSNPGTLPYRQNRRATPDEREVAKRWMICGDGVKQKNIEILNREFLQDMKKKN